MRITLEEHNENISLLRVDGKKLCYAINHGGIDETHKIIIRQSDGRNCPFIVGIGSVIHDGWASGGVEVGLIAGDDFVLDGRAALAKLTNAILEAIENLETITLEVL